MVSVASRAPSGGVKLPSLRVTRAGIIQLFEDHLLDLRSRLNVSHFAYHILSLLLYRKCAQGPTVRGKISTTCDCWSSSTKEGFFAVTIHWIEEELPGVWQLKSDLAGFVSIRHAHTGVRLGHALFKILHRIRISAKVRLTLFGYQLQL